MRWTAAARRSALLPLAAALATVAPVGAQVPGTHARTAVEPEDPAVAFLAPYGLQNFSSHYVDALSALLRARWAYDAGDHGVAQGILDRLWAEHPTGAASWGNLPGQPFGINIGTPPCYYALRMLSDTADWRVSHPGFGPPLRTARLTVLLVGRSNGVEPRNLQELLSGTGVPVQHTLEPLLLEDGSAVVHDSLELFREYVVAMTEGALGIETRILHLPNVDLAVEAKSVSGRHYASLVDAGQVWPFVSAQDVAETDWWWILYPSHVPDQYPAFQSTEFVTGGMGVGPQYGSPYFIIDDRWLVRKPPHLGSGPYSDVERETYLPQWLQHEFFHHLFRTYPKFGLEATSHQWFNLATWPADFEGRYEADYFHEALYKRLQGATPPLVAALRYATAGAPWGELTLNDVLGEYRREPVLNNWHIGSIQLSPQLEWQNLANVDWDLEDDLANGHLLTGPDCPYYGSWNGDKFDVVLERNALGDLTDEIAGFSFLGELYGRQNPPDAHVREEAAPASR